ncbi:MAG: hypothetical protein AAGF24_14630, partial [Cyanobacteria bacterium P01_H01_bin.121]
MIVLIRLLQHKRGWSPWLPNPDSFAGKGLTAGIATLLLSLVVSCNQAPTATATDAEATDTTTDAPGTEATTTTQMDNPVEAIGPGWRITSTGIGPVQVDMTLGELKAA